MTTSAPLEMRSLQEEGRSAHPADTEPMVDLPRAIVLDAADGGLAFARALRRRGVPVTLLAVPSYRWVTRARGIDGRIAETNEDWARELAALAEQGPGVLIPASDRAVEFVSRHRDEIAPGLRSFESPSSAHLKLMDKASLYSLAGEAGVRAPVVQLLRDHAEIDAVAARAAYPSLLKPVLSHVYRELFGSNRNILVHNPDELRKAAGPALDAGLEWLVTEFVPGPGDEPGGRGDGAARRRLARARVHALQAAPAPAVLRCGLGPRGGPRPRRDGAFAAPAGVRRASSESAAWRPSATPRRASTC